MNVMGHRWRRVGDTSQISARCRSVRRLQLGDCGRSVTDTSISIKIKALLQRCGPKNAFQYGYMVNLINLRPHFVMFSVILWQLR